MKQRSIITSFPSSSFILKLCMKLVLICVLLLLEQPTSIHAQQLRAITSLGSKLKKFRNKKNPNNNNNGGEYIVQGESSSSEDNYSSFQWIFDSTKQQNIKYIRYIALEIVITIAIIIILQLLVSRRWNNKKVRKDKKKKEGGDDDEIIIEEEEDIEQTSAHDHVEVGFENIKFILKNKKDRKKDRIILDGSIKGRAQPGRMLAIMGPSGSGKSTLVHALAGKIKYNSKLHLQGQRYVNGELLSADSMLPSAFIEQEVNFFPHMTVKETLDFRVELKLGKNLNKSQRNKVVTDLMNLLGLSKSSNTIVGNSKVRGLSGGERKRLSIAVEMISSPSVIFLDEPTSGLDSYQATQVIETLRKLANAGKTVIAVIHQPSQHVFGLFDDLLLLSEGKLMYFGELNKVRSHLHNIGYKASSDMGTAEHVLECVSRTNGDNVEESTNRLHHIAEECKKLTSNVQILPSNNTTTDGEKIDNNKRHHFKKYQDIVHRPRAGLLRQFKLLLNRALHETFRGKTAIIIKIVQQVTLGVIYGGIYSLGTNQASIQDRIGLLSLVAIGATNMAMASTVRTFPKEKAIVSGEMSSKMYSAFPYFIAKALSEIPLVGLFNSIFAGIVYRLTGLNRAKNKFLTFLSLVSLHSIGSEAIGLVMGAISPSSDVALALFPPIVVLNIIFDGKNISEENTPRLLRWIPKIGIIRWGFEGLALNEFDGLTFDTSGPRRGPVAKTGAEALERFGLVGNTVADVMKAQALIIGVCWGMAYLGLSFTRQKFMSMQVPTEDDSAGVNGGQQEQSKATEDIQKNNKEQ